MKVSVKDKGSARSLKVVVVPVFEGEIKKALKALPGKNQAVVEKAAREHQFKGKKNQQLYLSSLKSPLGKVLLFGLGKKGEVDIQGVRVAAGKSIRVLNGFEFKEIAFLLDPILESELDPEKIVVALTEAAYLVSYKFSKYKKESKSGMKVTQFQVVSSGALSSAKVRRFVEKGRILANSINGVREYGLEPSNLFTPAIYADRVRKTAREIGLNVEVFNKSKIKSLKMGGVIGVSQGSANDPRFVVIKYRPKGAKKHVCLVGKGVTFDTGGISLKPPKGMEKMKYDMLGSATAIQSTFAIARLKIPINITCITPLVENQPDGNAINPGDILTMMSGKTVEVLNTDAEGRLILADALHYAKTLKPDFCIDLATLTGAVMVALGDYAMGLMSKDQGLADDLLAVGQDVWDRCWQLPLWDEYGEEMKSDIADLKNINATGYGGTITAGAFLSNFIEGVRWAHLDIAGTAWQNKDSGYSTVGPSGVGVRLLVNWVEKL